MDVEMNRQDLLEVYQLSSVKLYDGTFVKLFGGAFAI